MITKRGFPHGEREERADADSQSGLCAIDLFVTEEGAYTTVASAVAMLVVLALLFSAVSAVWSLSRSADVQAVADSAALAGSNVVSSYHTAATVVDASIASLGFAGLAITGTGLVALLIPGARSQGVKAIDAGLRILDMRNDFERVKDARGIAAVSCCGKCNAPVRGEQNGCNGVYRYSACGALCLGIRVSRA